MVGKLAVVSLVCALVVGGTEHPGWAKKGAKKRKKASAPTAALTKDGLPNVQSAAAIVVDLDTGEELYAKHPDAVRPIASTTKLFVALVVRDKKVPLDGEATITKEDRQYARGGARSRLLEGRTFKNHDLLRAMLIASDNRACTALARGAGMTVDELIAAMNAKAHALGLTRTKFTDPSGLNGNESTPREMAVALRLALADKVIAEVMATKTYVVHSTDKSTKKKQVAIQYTNTNHVIRNHAECLGGKTGYTDEARYCLAVAGKLGGRRVGMVFLGADGELTRFADYDRVAKWIAGGGLDKPRPKGEAGGSGDKPAKKGGGVGALVDPPPAAVTPRLGKKR